MNRIIKNLFTPKFIVQRYFSSTDFLEIEEAVKESERLHGGEVVFAVEAQIDVFQLFRGATARQRALEVFSEMRVWDTEKNNGILIYLLLSERDIEIVADRGINAVVPGQTWEEISKKIENSFSVKNYKTGILTAIADITDILKAHFPPIKNNINELSNKTLLC